MDQYEFGFTDENGAPNRFGVFGISAEVADGILNGLYGVATITEQAAVKVTQVREEVVGSAPRPTQLPADEPKE